MFIETPRFPDDIGYGAQGGAMYSTSIVKSISGRHSANKTWAYPMHEYDVGFPVRSLDKLAILTDYFHVCAGKWGGFRFKDHKDYKSCRPLTQVTHLDQSLGTGNASTTQFQLYKYYTIGAYTQQRIIQKPVSGTILIGVNGTLTGSGFTIDYTKGIVTFTVAPTTGAVLTWGGEFDVPVRFKEDFLLSDIEAYRLAGLEVKVEEIRI